MLILGVLTCCCCYFSGAKIVLVLIYMPLHCMSASLFIFYTCCTICYFKQCLICHLVLCGPPLFISHMWQNLLISTLYNLLFKTFYNLIFKTVYNLLFKTVYYLLFKTLYDLRSSVRVH